MLKIITNNFWIKIFCLLIAFGIWAYVTSGESQVDDFPGSIPVEVRNKPEELVVIKDVEFVDLRIITEQGVWKTLSAETFEAYIDLAGLEEGTHEVPVRVNSSVSGVQIVEINPSKILVRLEPVVEKEIPVTVKTEGNAAEGYAPGEATTNPDTVTVFGAESIVASISEAVATIKLNGESEAITGRSATLTAYGENHEAIKNLEFVPSQVSVDLQIVRATQTKTVGIKALTTGVPADGYWVSKITTDPSTVVVTGSSSLLARTEYVETQEIDVSGLSSNKFTTANITLPSGLNLVSGQLNQVEVTVEISSIESTKDIFANLAYLNLADNIRVADTDPDSVKVVVSGPSDQLANITSNDVIINFDLAGKEASTDSYEINNSMISVPEGIGVINIIPSSITIKLENK